MDYTLLWNVLHKAKQETWEMWVGSLGKEDPFEEEMATHSSILTWRIPWTEEPGGLQSMGWQGVRHDWVINTKQMEEIIKFKLFKCLVHWRQNICEMDW